MLSPGSCIEGHEILRHVTSGAMSQVYEGRHTTTGRAVAVKVLHLDLCRNADLVTRFLNEAKTLAFFGHARIVSLFAWGSLAEGPPYMVLEWLPHSLEHALRRVAGPLTTRTAVAVAAQIASAAEVLHERGVVHRDLKPANILSTDEDLARAEIKLADLGLIKVLRGQRDGAAGSAAAPVDVFPLSTGGSDLLGSFEYMAPEQWIRTKSVDCKADVYSLGVILFRMITGSLPFNAEQQPQKEWMALHVLKSPPLHLLDGRAPPRLRELVACMMDKKAAPRPTMRDVAVELARLQ